VFLQNYRGPGIIEFKGIIFLLKIPWNMSTVSWTECTTMGSTSSWIESLLRPSTAHSVCWLATAANTNGAIGGAHRRWLLSATVHYPRWFFSLQTRHKMGNLPRGSSGGGGDRSRARDGGTTPPSFINDAALLQGSSDDEEHPNGFTVLPSSSPWSPISLSGVESAQQRELKARVHSLGKIKIDGHDSTIYKVLSIES
jgi:hypothetical protein